MARKSKAKYEMKGHSIPGIKGFKDTTLEDGRAASSAFQMQSPLHAEGDDDGTGAYDLDLSDVKSSDYDPNRGAAQAAGQGGVGYAAQEFGKLEWKDGKLVRKGSEVEKDKITEQVDKYEGGEGTYEEYKAEMEAAGTEPIPMGAWAELNSQNVESDVVTGDYDASGETYVDTEDMSGGATVSADGTTTVDGEIVGMSGPAFSGLLESGELSTKDWQDMSPSQQQQYEEKHPELFPG